MSHHFYLVCPELQPSFIRETDPVTGPESNPAHSLHDRSDEELASVRLVLRRLTALRIRNEQDAEDLVQETLMTMTEKYPGEGLEKGLLVWSMGILRKKVGNYYRKVQRYTALDEGSGRRRGRDRRPRPSYSPESRLLHQELRLLIRRIVEEFPSHQRRPLELSLAGLATHEIVRSLHPERYQNVINRLYRGRKRLIRELSRNGYRPDSVRRCL